VAGCLAIFRFSKFGCLCFWCVTLGCVFSMEPALRFLLSCARSGVACMILLSEEICSSRGAVIFPCDTPM
jgi:hypothetical protein